MKNLLSNLRINLLCLSVVYIAIGAVLLIFPQVSIESLCGALGVAAIILGVISAAIYFIRKSFREPNRYGFSIGIACILFGLFAVIRSEELAVAFTQVLAICMIADSVLKLQFSMDLFRLNAKLWWVVLAVAAIMAGLTLTALLDPFGDPQTKNVFTYSILVADGVVNILTVAFLSYYLRRMQKLTPVEPGAAGAE